MPYYHYLIVGGGMTADAAIRGIREADGYGSIGLVGAETERPYNRPPLSKGLWKGKAMDSIWRGTDATDAALHLGRTVVHLDPPNRRVIDDQGAEYTYEQLLLATGGTPRRLPFGGDHILYFRTLQDYLALRGLTERGRRFAVIGGGFIGSEIAAALAMNGKEVVLLLAGENIGEGIFPPGLARFVTDYYRQRGVEVLANSTVTGLETDGQRPIYNDPKLKVGQISVESHKGVVQLSGFVDSRQAATRAVELARSVRGVKSVKDSLIVK